MSNFKLSVINKDSGYENLQALYDRGPNASTSTVLTRSDKEFNATRHLFDTASRVSDAKLEIKHCIETLSDPNATKAKTKEVLNSMNNIVLPLLTIVSDSVSEAAQRLAPMAGMKALHRRNETDRKIENNKNTSKKRPALQAIENYINKGKTETLPCRSLAPSVASKENDAPSRPTLRQPKKLPLAINPPYPRKGAAYSKTKFLEVMMNCKHALRHKMMNAIMKKG